MQHTAGRSNDVTSFGHLHQFLSSWKPQSVCGRVVGQRWRAQVVVPNPVPETCLFEKVENILQAETPFAGWGTTLTCRSWLSQLLH